MATSLPHSLTSDSLPEKAQKAEKHKVGYRPEIFEKINDREKFACGYCENILREPLQADCGHRFCTECKETIQDLKNAGQPILCKICKKEECSDADSQVDPKQMFPDRGFKREMNNIRTICPNEMCVWAGPFKDYINHEIECKHQPVACEQCGEAINRQKLEQHKNKDCPQRIVKCDHCKAEMAQVHKTHHTKECPKFPDSCNQCNKTVPRDQMNRHKKLDCSNRMIVCPLEGCGAEQSLGRFQQHVQKDQPKHLAWVLARLKDMEEHTIANFEPTSISGAAGSSRLIGKGDVHQSVEILKGKLDQLEQQLQDSIRRGGAPDIYGSDQAMGGGEASAGFSIGTTERLNAMEFKVNSLEPILSVLHGEMNRCIGAIEALEAKLQQETVMARDFQKKLEQSEQTISTLTASMTQKEVKLRELEARVGNLSQDVPDGTLLWKIAHFSQVRQEAIAGTVSNIHSRPFYTGPIGYKMCVRLYPNGDGMGKGTHLSLFFTLMRSNHDALLPWPFKQKVYFMLIDQHYKKHVVDAFRSEPNSSSFQRPTSEMNIATGCPLFMQLSKLSLPGQGYLKDDTMYIRIVVETDGLSDHLKQFDPRTVPLATS